MQRYSPLEKVLKRIIYKEKKLDCTGTLRVPQALHRPYPYQV